jgi:DNA polymerase-1
MLLQVHDELVFEIPPEEVERIRELVRSIMEGVYELRVPLKVDVKTGPNWAEVC